MNNILLVKLASEIIKYNCIDSVIDVEDSVNYPVDVLHILNHLRVSPHSLRHKVEAPAPVMLL